ncbi:hypothetical protein SLS58_002466 [Diplodia intermedia]|uniref:FAS1 domain-containing protein n=1 Tax=Diplodia intermedia TaxID=856260 RepID=A0ABR3TZK3_9PEZI
MKFAGLLPLAALGATLVIPDEAMLHELATQSESHNTLAHPEHPIDSLKDALNDLVDDTRDEFESVEFGLRGPYHDAKDVLGDAFDKIVDAEGAVWEKIHESGFDMDDHTRMATTHHLPHMENIHHLLHMENTHHLLGMENTHRLLRMANTFLRPHHSIVTTTANSRRLRHSIAAVKPNQTVYELIAKSKYTTKLAKLINDDPELVKLLNGTTANFTVFAPTDKAFEKIPKHGKEPSKEFIKKVLLYHISPEFYPAGRVLHTYTIPTLYKEPALGGDDFAQRLSVNIGFKGLTLNFYSRIVAINIFGTNGVIHGLDTILIPPPKVADIISLLPGEFSTLTLGLEKTGLFDILNSTDHAGGTFFAPSNWAFKKLGPRINAFLFSSYGEKYLKALLKYHIVPEQTLYSDAFYRPSKDDEHSKGYFHVDLPTLLDDKPLSVDIGSHGPFTEIKINGFSRVAIQNGIAKDGVIQVVSSVLIPPKTAGMNDFWEGEHLSVDEFKARLEPFVESGESEAEAEELGWGEL